MTNPMRLLTIMAYPILIVDFIFTKSESAYDAF